MKNTNNYTSRFIRFAAVTTIVTYALIAAATTTALAQESDAGISFDGLERIEDSTVAMAYIDPEADFSVFKRIAILDPKVAFRSNWRRDQNRSRRRNISVRDMERIKADVASLFKEVFTERLEADDGFEVVDVADYDVLLLRPAIIDLDINVPDRSTAGNSRSFTTSAGAATLYIELFDSVSGTIIGRAADRQVARSPGGRVAWSSGVTNTAEARRMFRRWADVLRGFLDQHYTK
jgi:hypothetical protein